MKAVRLAVLAILFTIFAYSSVFAQQTVGGSGRDPQTEQPILDRLAKINPDAVPVFVNATSAMDAGSDAQAKVGFEQVLTLAPDFPDALRRLAMMELSLEENDAALQHAQKAKELDDSPQNKAALAHVLMAFESPEKNLQAYDLALEASRDQPDDSYYQYILAEASWAVDKKDTFKQSAAALVQMDPSNPLAHYYAGVSAAFDEQWERSVSELNTAEKLGMPKEAVEDLLSQGIRTQAQIRAAIRWGGIVLAAWLVSMGLLFLVGLQLSRMTLQAVNQQARMAQFEISRGESRVRRIYRAVIAAASTYYFLSIPILIIVVLALAAGLAYLIMSAGSIPVKLVIFAAIAIIATLYSLVRSLFVRVKDSDPGRTLTKIEAPYLWKLVEDVAGKMGTRPVDVIFLTPGMDAAVYERGSVLKKLRGKGKRCLILGMGTLNALNQGELQALLAHEYGHFLNRDTAGGNLATQVQTSMWTMAKALGSQGQAHWYNPAWLFVSTYYKIFSRVVLGASRLQEILADRYAAIAYGTANMRTGLQNLTRYDLAFHAQVDREFEQARAEKRQQANLYTLEKMPFSEDLEKKLREYEECKSGPYESHPSFQERMAYIERISGSNWAGSYDSRPALDLLSNADALQQEMTQLVNGRVKGK